MQKHLSCCLSDLSKHILQETFVTQTQVFCLPMVFTLIDWSMHILTDKMQKVNFRKKNDIQDGKSLVLDEMAHGQASCLHLSAPDKKG